MVGPIIKEVLGFGSTKFEVTKKGSNNEKNVVDGKLLASHLVLLSLSLFGIGLAFYKANILGIERYIIPLIWLFANTLYMLAAVIFDVRNNKKYKKFTPNRVEKYHLLAFLDILGRSDK